MDDATFEGPKLTPDQVQTLNRIKRRANDNLRVYNPTSEDYVVVWDRAEAGGGFLVPNRDKDIGYGKGQAVHIRYVAEKYAREMADKILGEKMVAAVIAENDRREARGVAKLTKYGEEFNFTANIRPDNVEMRTKLMNILVVGIESRFGGYTTPTDNQPKRDPKSMDEQILSSVGNRPAVAISQTPTVEEILQGPTVPTASPAADLEPISEVLASENPPQTAKEELLNQIAQ
jgi:hypothetical protein